MVVDGVVSKSTEFASAVKRALAAAKPRKITATHIIVAIPESRVFTSLVTLPKVQSSEIASTLRWQMRELVPANPDELIVDYQSIHARQNNERQVVLVASPVTLVTPLAESLTKAGFIIDQIVPRSVGLAQLFARPVHTPVLIIDHEQSDILSLIITKNGTARFSTTVPLDHHTGRVSTAIEHAIKFYELHDGQGRKVREVIILPHPDADLLKKQLQGELSIGVRLADGPWENKHAPQRLRALLSNIGLLQLHNVRLNLLPETWKAAALAKTVADRLAVLWYSELFGALMILAVLAALFIQAKSTEAAIAAKLAEPQQAINQELLNDERALSNFTAAYQAKDAKRSQKASSYQQIVTQLGQTVTPLIIEYDPAKQETKILGDRLSRENLAEAFKAVRSVFPKVTINNDDWMALENAPFHLTIPQS